MLSRYVVEAVRALEAVPAVLLNALEAPILDKQAD
jgi:hypothetical protein